MRVRQGTGQPGTQGGRGAGQGRDLLSGPLQGLAGAGEAGRPGGGHCTCETLVPLGRVASIRVVRGASGRTGSGHISFTCLFIFLSFFFGCSLWLANLSSLTRDGTLASAVKAQNPKHRTARELPRTRILNRQIKRIGEQSSI